MSISQTKRVSQFVTSRADVLRCANELRSEIKDACYKRLWPSDSRKILQVELKGTILALYPQYNLFMPSISWVNEYLTSDHSRLLCRKEATAIVDFAQSKLENVPLALKVLSIQSKEQGSFASRLSAANTDYKTLLDICMVVPFENLRLAKSIHALIILGL